MVTKKVMGTVWWVLVVGQCMILQAMGLVVQPVCHWPAFACPFAQREMLPARLGANTGRPPGGSAFDIFRVCHGAHNEEHKLMCTTQRPWFRGVGPVMMARKEFDKKYDNNFDNFRTSGSMPSIPNVAEQYSQAASYAREKGVEVKEGDPAFGKRITEAQEALKKERDEGLKAYDELKGELLGDTAYVGILGMSAFIVLFSEHTSLSYALGAFGSMAYAFLLTRTADRMGEQGNASTMFDPGTPLRFAILFFLIILAAKNRDTLEIIPILFGFFIPYKLASLRPAFVSLPPVKDTEVRVYRKWFDSSDTPPFKIEYGSKILGQDAKRKFNYRPRDDSGAKTQGSSAPLGKRNIASVEEQYEALKKGTLD